MSRSTIEYLHHILDETHYLQRHTQGLGKEQFLTDDTLKRAFVRSLEIIGEAAKQVPMDFRNKYPDIEWRAMTGMRNVLIRKYFGINYEVVWDVVSHTIPMLNAQVEAAIQQELGNSDLPS
jgi:uncharacterized protein with HEPN domain